MTEKLKINDKVRIKDPSWPWENKIGICASNQVIHVGKQVCMVKFEDNKFPILYSVEFLEKV
jgi:hypothetical protein